MKKITLNITIGLLFALLLLSLGIQIYHDIKYKCVKSHLGEQMEWSHVYEAPMTTTVCVCDSFTLRENK